MRRFGPAAALATVLVSALGVLTPTGATAAPAGTFGPQPSPGVSVDAAVGAALDQRGNADLWVAFDERADLSGAAAITDWAERGRFVHDALRATADRAQGSLVADLTSAGATVVPFWAANVVLVRGGDAEAVAIAQRHPEVREVTLAGVRALPEPTESTAVAAAVDDVEWGVAAVRAPEAWAEFATRGEGVTVGVVDSGAQFDHPAIAASYRGANGDGTFTHDHNWHDPSNGCAPLGPGPCDNTGHGTHVTGTIAGDGGEGARIGVAPGVRWISAKGCETNSCSDFALVSSMQWMLAPTDRTGGDPRPDLRPHVVNNSWGGGNPPPVFREVIQAWVAAGIVPVFSAGNNGPACSTLGAPGLYPEPITAAAHDAAGAIGWFSSRGPGPAGAAPGKPDVAAPGVAVRSSVPGNGYALYDGTSMAAPHVTGAVALLLAASPASVGDTDGVKTLLGDAAVDADDVSCGGTRDDNGVYGEGRLDVFEAITAAPRGAVGTVAGTVSDAGGAPLAAATVAITGDGFARTVQTAPDGTFTVPALAGVLDVTVSKYGYTTRAVAVDLVEDGTVAVDVALDAVPWHTVTGVVTLDDGETVAGITVTVLGTPLASVTTGADGRFTIPDVAEGSYELAAYGSRCVGTGSLDVTVGGPVDVTIMAADRVDAFGYRCRETASSWVEGDTSLNPGTGSGQERTVPLPFPFRYYGEYYTSVEPFSDGEISLRGRRTVEIDVFRTRLFFESRSAWRTKVIGEAPNRQVVIEWHDVAASYYNDADGNDYLYRLSLEVLLGEDGTITMQWRDIDGTPQTDPMGGDRGAWALVGIEKHDGTIRSSYSTFEPVLRDEVAVTWFPPAAATVSGTVTDANDGGPIVNARVSVHTTDGDLVREVWSKADGSYLVEAPVGTHRLTIAAPRYTTVVRTVTATADAERLTRDAALATGRLTTDVAEVAAVTGRQAVQQRTVTVTNTGTRPLTYRVDEARQPGAPGSLSRQWNSGLVGTATISAVAVDHTTGNVWIVDRVNRAGYEFTEDGTPTGRVLQFVPEDIPGEVFDTAWDPASGEICAHVGGTNLFTGEWFASISCMDPATGAFTWRHEPGFHPWARADGFAYRADTDVFYVAERSFPDPFVYTIAGRSHPAPGAILATCRLAGYPVIGLGWNPATKELVAGSRPAGELLRIEPDNCGVLGSMPGEAETLELDADGNAVTMMRRSNIVSVVETGVPVVADQPWVTVTRGTGTLAPGRSATVTVRVDPRGLEVGEVRRASLLVTTDAGRDHGVHLLPVIAADPEYEKAVNVGGDQTRDADGVTWSADRELDRRAPYGWTGQSRVITERDEDDRVARNAREGDFGYEFRGLPDGVYEVELVIADHWRSNRASRVFDVASDGVVLLDAYSPPRGRAVAERVTVEVVGGTLRLAFLPRDGRRNLEPLLNGIRVTHRPDLG